MEDTASGTRQLNTDDVQQEELSMNPLDHLKKKVQNDRGAEGGDGNPERLLGLSLQDDGGDENRLTVLTWNLDGLDTWRLKQRAGGLFSTLKRHRPDVVLLQELIVPYIDILIKHFVNYEFLQGNDKAYFTGIMLKKSRVKLLHSTIVKYPTTEMRRNLLVAHVDFFGHELCVMTSHLESCRSSSQERLNQMRRVWKRMRETAEHVNVIFGGDTNLRDWEVVKLGGLPMGISDVWEVLGRPVDCAYTWDTETNDNKDIPNSIRLRFDRVFLRAAQCGVPAVPESMQLVGLQRLKCNYFTSDHWGILCGFAFEPLAELKEV